MVLYETVFAYFCHCLKHNIDIWLGQVKIWLGQVVLESTCPTDPVPQKVNVEACMLHI